MRAELFPFHTRKPKAIEAWATRHLEAIHSSLQDFRRLGQTLNGRKKQTDCLTWHLIFKNANDQYIYSYI